MACPKISLQTSFCLQSLITDSKLKKLQRKLNSDTIGGILISLSGCWIATSSGGPWLKECGRIGSSALKGAGFDFYFGQDEL